MRATICSKAINTADGPKGCGQYYVKRAYYGMSTASEVCLIFTTQINRR